MVQVFIDGSSGTTGLKIAQRLRLRSDLTLLSLPEEKRKDKAARQEMIDQSHFTILCLPDDAARESAQLCTSTRTRLIDASTSHRTAPGWCYGFPELSKKHRQSIVAGSRIAVPGCHASGFSAIVYPLVREGILPPDYPLVCHSVTGYSGGGKTMIAAYESKDRDNQLSSPGQYALSGIHKHLPEMTAVCSLAFPPIFNPIVADFYSGMAVSVPLFANYLKRHITPASLHDFYADYYRSAKLISVLPFTSKGTESGFLYANTLAGKDSMELMVSGNEERLNVCARLCNLGKGASGAAMQCLNLMMGCEETTGLIL